MSQSLISDQNLKVDMLIGNSISNHKFHFIYCFSCENGKSLALIMLWNLSVSSCLFHRVFENPLRYLPPLYVDRLKVTKKQLVVSVLWWCGIQKKSHINFFISRQNGPIPQTLALSLLKFLCVLQAVLSSLSITLMCMREGSVVTL